MSVPATWARPSEQPCARRDVGGLSVGEVLSELDTPHNAGPKFARAKKLRELALIFKEAVDYLASNEAQDWNVCAYDSVVLVDPATDFPVVKSDRDKLARLGVSFVLGDARVVYMNVPRFRQYVLWRNQERKAVVGEAIFELYHEYRHVLGDDQAQACTAHNAFLDKLVRQGWLTSDRAERIRTLTEEALRTGFKPNQLSFTSH